jgi:hypothetical protein
MDKKTNVQTVHVLFYWSLFGTEVNNKMSLATKMFLWGLLICVILAFVPATPCGLAQVNLQNEHIILSTTGSAKLGGLRFKDGDLVEYDPNTNTASLFFSEGLFSNDEDIDAVDVLPNRHIILSTTGTATLGGLTFRDGSLVEYDPGTNTATLFLSEGLFAHGHINDIDAADILPNGHIVLSTTRTTVLGGLRFRDGDLVDYNPVTDMATLFFSEGLFSHNADIDAVDVLEDGSIILSTTGSAQLGGLRFHKDDLVRYYPLDYTDNPNLAGRATLYFTGGYFANGGENIDAVDIVDPLTPTPEPATLLLLGSGSLALLRRRRA